MVEDAASLDTYDLLNNLFKSYSLRNERLIYLNRYQNYFRSVLGKIREEKFKELSGEVKEKNRRRIE